MRSRAVQAAFERFILSLPVSVIRPQREVTPSVRKSAFYKQIAASLEHIGLIEPLVVFEKPGTGYLLLDGHLRLEIMKSMKWSEVRCIIARDDEAYTYNKRVNYVPPVAQHFMLLEVLKNGVSEERVAAALNVDIHTVRLKRDLLKGICAEVVDLLHDRHLNAQVFAILRRMKPLRQIEATEHMIASDTFSVIFAKAILAFTKPEMLVDPDSKRTIQAQSAAGKALLENESDGLLRDLKAVEDSYGADVLTLTVSCGYLERLLENSKVTKYLERNHLDTLRALRALLADFRSGELSPV
jgi:ParB-like chromosome segregation protein Spo0J